MAEKIERLFHMMLTSILAFSRAITYFWLTLQKRQGYGAKGGVELEIDRVSWILLVYARGSDRRFIRFDLLPSSRSCRGESLLRAATV
ncbi:hypothetical protein BKA64DRAFT_130956 [Cadophora sp. MPI-SDFR-AT-0126]|nr:hypothetical protein BKA64DRAFT_130956 [Leotiomycetes sp. MPI-SDFR-AT-0126]